MVQAVRTRARVETQTQARGCRAIARAGRDGKRGFVEEIREIFARRLRPLARRGGILPPEAGIFKPGNAIPRRSIVIPRLGIALPRRSIAILKHGSALPGSGTAIRRLSIAIPCFGIAQPKHGIALPQSGTTLLHSGVATHDSCEKSASRCQRVSAQAYSSSIEVNTRLPADSKYLTSFSAPLERVSW